MGRWRGVGKPENQAAVRKKEEERKKGIMPKAAYTRK